MWIGLALALALWGGLRTWTTRPVARSPGVLAPDAPRQTATREPPFAFRGMRLTPRAAFSLRARVLSTRRYGDDPESRLAPNDVAFGWGPMSDSAVLARLAIGQSGRWYFSSWAGDAPAPPDEIARGSANMHLVPASDPVAAQIGRLRVGQVVRLDGLLVDADAPDGWTWRTSLTRDDTGAGACELVLVRALVVER